MLSLALLCCAYSKLGENWSRREYVRIAPFVLGEGTGYLGTIHVLEDLAHSDTEGIRIK